MVTETIKDVNCKFNVAFALALIVKNSLHNVNVFISNQLPNDKLPALENISTRGINSDQESEYNAFDYKILFWMWVIWKTVTCTLVPATERKNKQPKLYNKVVMLLHKGNVCYWWTGEGTVSWKEYKQVLIKTWVYTHKRVHSFCTMMHLGRQRWIRLWLKCCVCIEQKCHIPSAVLMSINTRQTSGGDSEVWIKRYWRMGYVMSLQATPNRPGWGTT